MINFNLTISAQLQETDVYKELVKQCDQDISDFQQKLKSHTTAVATHEVSFFRTEILDICNKISRLITSYFIINLGAVYTHRTSIVTSNPLSTNSLAPQTQLNLIRSTNSVAK